MSLQGRLREGKKKEFVSSRNQSTHRYHVPRRISLVIPNFNAVVNFNVVVVVVVVVVN